MIARTRQNAAKQQAKAMPIEIAADIADARWAAAWPGAEDTLAVLCDHVLGAQAPAALAQRVIEVSFLLTDDAQMRALNKAHRGKDQPTNVLSFPSGDVLVGEGVEGPLPPALLGDIAMGYETVLREAKAGALVFQDHATHLVIHGILHLLGFDHIEEEEAAEMEAKEIAFCRDFGIANPYSA
jgi:probable rRNA maturation factor